MLVGGLWGLGLRKQVHAVGGAEQSTLAGAWEIAVLKTNVNNAGLAQLFSEGKNITG